MEFSEDSRTVTLGPAVAAILSASLGCFSLGVTAILAEKFSSIKILLTWWEHSGPITGVSGTAIIIWLVSWIILHLLLKRRNPSMFLVGLVSAILIALSWILLYPPVYRTF